MTVKFETGRIYDRRADIHAVFGGQQQGGISTPTRVSAIFLFSAEAGQHHGYEDGWSESGESVFLYTGEGQVGDMAFIRGNRAIRDHVSNGRDLHLFVSVGKSQGYRYVGQFVCTSWETRNAPDTNGDPRTALVFHLVPLEEELEPESTSPAFEPLDELRSRAILAATTDSPASPREARRLYRQRSQDVRAYVLARANGKCEACGEPAPFSRSDGKPYLEPHHTRRLSDGGPDHPRWVAATCPNCHREIHYGANGDVLNRRLEERLGEIESGA